MTGNRTIHTSSGGPAPADRTYRLAPLQEGMLYHHLSGSGRGVDVAQMVCTLPEAIDLPCLERAWQAVTDRHSALRAAFGWGDDDRPFQWFRDAVRIGIADHDWRDIPAGEQEDRLAAFLAEDRERGFELSGAPLFRLAHFRMGAEHHVLVWTFHHIILDGRSLPILLDEVFAIHDARFAGGECRLPDPTEYRDVLVGLDGREPASTEEAYWRESMAGLSEPTRLAIDRGAGGDARSATVGLRLPEGLTNALGELARENGVTVNTVVQGAWALLLARYSGTQDVVFGVTRACRHSRVPGSEHAVGFFMNTLPMRIRTASDPRLGDWLREIRRQHLALREFERTPIARIREWIDLPKSRPLFESLLVFENHEWRDGLRAQGGRWLDRQFRLVQQTGLPLTVGARHGRELDLRFSHDTHRLDAGDIERMAAHLRTVLEGMVADPSRRLSEIPIHTAPERHQLLAGWNDTARVYPRDRPVQWLFEQQRQRTPDAVAVVDANRQLTYRELDALADGVSDALRRLGAAPGQPVGLWGMRSAEIVAGLLGILKAGAAYVPLPPDAPPERVRTLVEDAGITLVVARERPDWIGDDELPRHVPIVGTGAGDGTASAKTPSPHGDALACILYTSGTTGVPKGACVAHRGLVNLLQHRTQTQFRPGDFQVGALTAPLHFDGSIVQIFSPLITGGTLVIADSTHALGASPWYDRLTALTGASSVVAALVHQSGLPKSARVIGLGAEPVPGALLAAVRDSTTVERLLTGYGVTECSCYSTDAVVHERNPDLVAPGLPADAPPLNDIGRPIANTRVLLLDAHRQPVPIGVPGEIYIGGDGVGPGYWNRPESTAERFVPDPFEPGRRLFRTGDQARRRPDGSLEFLGRLDHQIKLRGFRIEPGEIESLLARHPGVRQAVVLVNGDPHGDGRLAAYVVPATPGNPPDDADLRHHLQRLLPAPMIPADFVSLEELPLTSNGKVDRKALPVPRHDPSDAAPAHGAPRTPLEEMLAGAPDRLELPSDGSPTDPGMETCPTVDLLLEPGVARGLESIGLQSQASSFVSLAAAFNLLLGRLAGVEDLVVGIPVAGRHEPETEAMIGLFLNNLALRTDLSGNPTFRGLLARVNEAVLDALDHSDLPFDRLVAELNPSRSLRHAPVFQVLVNHFDTDALTPVLPGLEVVPVPCTPPGSRYDLTAYFQPGRDGTRVTLAYHPKVFSAARMRGLLDQFAALLEQIVADPDRPIGEYSLVTDGARRWLPDPLATLDGDPHETVLESFRRIVRESPGLGALAQSERAWTYGALAVEVDRLAGTFRQAGVRAGAVVAVTGAPSPGLVASLMAVWQAGGVFLPLDPRLPEARQHLMARIARATHLVRVGMPTGDGSPDGWPRDIVRIAVDAVPAAGEDTSATALADDEPPAAEAYVFFTSGTTGIPKAILGTHAGLAHFLHWQRTTFGIGPGDRVAQLTGLSFDVVLRDLFLPLGSGATLCLPPEGHDLAADRVLPWMERERITLLHTVPALASTWMAGVPPGTTLGAMRWVFFAGEPLSEKLVREWRGAFAGHTGIVNLYGPTETTLVKCSFEVPDPPLPGIQPVGRALPGAQAWVQNDANQFCGVGEPGDIVIRTPYRTLGYLDAPGGTPRCFRPNPFGTDSRDLVYFTGDRGRLRPDGHLDILGRNDDQAKINGVRVEPAEVNAVLGAHPGIRSSLVLACGDATGATRLVAYLVPRDPGCPPAVGELRRFLARTLPESMVPAAFAVLAAFPLSPNGKVDRKALPAPESVALGSGTIHAPPRTPVEKALAGIWCEVLGKQQVGLDDNFFALGGHSLLAMRVVARIRDGFPVDLQVRTLFEHPTLAALAERVVELHREPGASAVPLLRSAALDTEKPLSFAQQRLWFLDSLSPGSPAYNIPTATRLLGLLDAPALGRALRELVRRHEVLRTTFAAAEGEPEQIVAADSPFRLESVDLRSLPADSREPEARRLAAAEAARPFDLSRDPMLRASLLRMADDDHLFVFTLHHIAADAWSMGILWRELALLYRAFAAGLPSPLAPLPLQYADYALWQRQWLRGEVLERQLDYWKNQLAGAPPLLELPVDFPRPAVQGHRGTRLPLALDPALTRALHDLARREGATPFMTLLAAWQVLLARLAGQDDIVVGAPIAGRNRTELEGLIGFFVNTLVLRSDLSGNPSFRTLLHRVRDVTLGAYAHQDLPFEKLVEELQPERNAGHAPLFQSMLVFQNTPRTNPAFGDLEVHPMPLGVATAKFDLTLVLQEGADGLRGSLEYDTDLFEPATIVRWLGHFDTLLRAIVADPSQPIGLLPLLSHAERQRILVDWNRTATPQPGGLCLHHLFAAQARRSPDAVAVVFGRQRLDYRELDRRADALADRLRDLGVGPDVVVGLCVQRSVEMLVALLGILKAGGAYLPLDPSHPAARLEFMLADARPRVLLTQTSLRESLPAHRAETLCLDALPGPEDPRPRRDSPPPSPGDGSSLAYVLYTSGSTGQPKGVQIPRRALANFLLSMAREPGLAPGDRMLAITTLGFDIAALELLLPLVTGACVVIAERETTTDGMGLARLVADSGATVLQATPATWRMLVEAGWQGHPSLKLLCGGEALPRDLADQLLARCGELWNLYGPTETTIYSLGARVRAGHAIVIGGPIDNTRAHVLDVHCQPVPLGVPGELYLGGDGLARGYVGRPGLTAERFVPDPFGDAPDSRLYRTGDLVRRRPDGSIEFLGRLDHQIKLRGFRIEPGEIETSLSDCPGVLRAVVLLREDQPGEKRLVAYVVPRETAAPPAAAALRRHLLQKLPEYMVPAAFVVVGVLPLTPSGKVDRKALPAPETQAPGEGGNAEAPRTPAEELLAGIWSEVLGGNPVGLHDNFFAVGGHSLLAMRVVAKVRDAFSISLPVRALFENPTLAGLAERIEGMRSETAPPPAVPFRTENRSARMPLSFAQQRLWFLDSLSPGSPAYNIPTATRLLGLLDAPALGRALRELVRRHEVLRTTFAAAEGEPEQIVAADSPFRLESVDLRSLPADSREPEARRLAAAEAARPFDLSRDPMLRALLLRLGDTEHAFVLTLHHIAADGWSMAILWRELAVLYGAFAAGLPSPLAPLSLQYADYALWQHQWLRGEVLERQLDYWKNQLAGAPPLLELPVDFPRPAVQGHRGTRLPLALDPALTRALHDLARREGATPFMTLLAAWQVLLARLAGQDDVVVGAPIAGRNRTELEGLVGFFVNTLALRADLSGNPSFRALLHRVRDTTLGAYAHQDLPFEKLVGELQPERDPGHAPLFQAMLVFQNTPDARRTLGDLELRPMPLGVATAKFDLTLVLQEEADGLRGSLEYDTALFAPATIARWLGHFDTLLRAIVADPSRPVGQLPLLSDAERRLLLVDWNRTAVPYPREHCVHHLFAAQARRSPDAIALVFEGGVLSYVGLELRANRLAHALRALGVVPGMAVAVHLERSPDLPVALLAILKCGAHYVPLSVGYPPARLHFVLRDCRASWVVARGPLPEGVCPPSCRAFDLLARAADIDAAPAHDPAPAVAAKDLAYVIYTSGSTGEPKGVMVEHRSIARLLHGQHYATFGPDRVFLQLAPVAFDASTFEIWGALLHGASLVLAPDGPPDFAVLAALIRSHAVTTLWLTSGLFNELVDSSPDTLLGVREILAGGDALSPRHVRLARQRLGPAVRIVNGYGPTECTTFACCHTLPPDPVHPDAPIPIGRPIANTRAYVLDALGAPVPRGSLGELHLAGPGLARGYLNDPALTAQRFLPDPFSPEAGARMYRTGDMVRWLPDGTLDFAGRRDHQVKIRGFRVELGEIESALERLEGVRQAAVTLHAADPANPRLVAHLQGLPPDTTDEALRAALASSLPEYMLPAAFVRLPSLPLTPAGKVDRRALQAFHAIDVPRAGSARSSNVYEATIADLFAQLLSRETVGIDDNFFACGGHSLIALRMLHLVERHLGVRLPTRVLFEEATVRALARRVEAIRREHPEGLAFPGNEPLVTIQEGDGRQTLFLFPGGYGDESEFLTHAWICHRHLGPGFSMKAFRNRAWRGAAPLRGNIRAMARDCIEDMRRVQKRGPWHLAGLCVGGNLAFEVALQLQESGEEVALLALGDTMQPGPSAYRNLCLADPFRRRRQWIANSVFLRLPKLHAAMTSRGWRLLARRFLDLLGRRPPEPESPAGIRLAGDRHHHGEWCHYQNGEGYLRRLLVPPRGVFRGRIDLLLSTEMAPRPTATTWSRHATDGAEVHVLPGSHATYLVDGGERIADLYRRRLSGAG